MAVAPALPLHEPEAPDGSDAIPASPRSVSLDDLLTIAVVTPAQAVFLAAELLDAVGPAEVPPARVQAVVTMDGAVDVSETATGPAGSAVADLLDALVHSARRLPAHPQPYQLWLLHHLEAQAAVVGHPAERGTALRQALTEALGLDAGTRIRGELVALVEAYAAVAVSRPATSAEVNGAPLTSKVAPPVRSMWSHPSPPQRRGRGRRRTRARRMLATAVVLAVVLVGGAYAFVQGPGSGMVDDLFGDNHAAGSTRNPPAKAQKHHHRAGHAATGHTKAVPVLATRSAGRVRGVVLEKTGSCQPGSACPVKVTVNLSPATVGQLVGWRVGVVRGCSRQVMWSAETSITAQPGWTHVFASSSVPIPKTGRHLALVALTSTPTHAQSQPIPVAGTLHC